MRTILRDIGHFDSLKRHCHWARPMILLLMICHLGRFYSDAPVALAICFEHNHQGTEMLDADHHHEHHVESLDTHSGSDAGFKIEHCRDTYLGMNLIPPTVLSLPAETEVLVPNRSARALLLTSSPARQDLVLPIFHPPQLS